MYLSSEGSFGLRRSCTEIRRPTFWLCRGFVQTRESHHKCHRKVTTHIYLENFLRLSSMQKIVLFRGCSSRGWGGLLSKTTVSETISGSRAIHTCCCSYYCMAGDLARVDQAQSDFSLNSRKYIATREISTTLGHLSAVFTICYANAHAAIVQPTYTELARGP